MSDPTLPPGGDSSEPAPPVPPAPPTPSADGPGTAQPSAAPAEPDAGSAYESPAGPDAAPAQPDAAPTYAPPAGYGTAPGGTPAYAPPAAAGGPAAYTGATDPAAAPPYAAPAGPGAPQAYAASPQGYGVAAPPQGTAQPKHLAITALVLAGVGVVLAFIPFVTWFSGLVLLAGFIIGLVALISKKHGGKGFSIAAVIVAVVGWIISIVMTFASFGILGQAALEEAVRDDTSSSSEDSGSSSSTEDEAEEPAESAGEREELVLVETAFGRTSYDPNTWWYVVVIDNPNEDYLFDFASIDVEALDSAGTILDSSTDYRTILPGRTAISGTFYDVGAGEVTELDVRGPEATEAIHSPADETGAFTIEGLTATSDSFSTTVRGTVSGTFENDQELVEIVVVARNPAGDIIGAEWAYVDRLPAGGGKVQFEAMFLETMPGDTVYEAYAAL